MIEESVATGPESPMSAHAQMQVIIAEWTLTGQPDTIAALERYPNLRQDKSVILELAYAEHCQRAGSGQSLDAVEYCKRFPDYQHSLMHTLEVHHFAEDQLNDLDNLKLFHWPQPGEKLLNLYSIVRLLGCGGFARVYLARQE